ncbi:hypothetical protein POM88_049563 [Heracleum sosnowskyi]|uniref:Uncharacterized protein n=1 Tax=Heracleum sosnowskyi TaxID=360622 RepID=A0AAD8GXZ6_9APIA|nr:hypothetical protein POM88_049563 [Heracleum sosnowskyi]
MFLVGGDREKEYVIEYIFCEVDKYFEAGDFLIEYKMSALPSLYDHFLKLIKYLLENKEDRDQVVILFQDMLEVVTRDIMEDHISSVVDSIHGESEAWKEKIKRLYLLLTGTESAMDEPSNLEARRWISFFSNSLFMDMPSAPKVRNMLSFSVLIPYSTEEVLFSLHDLEVLNEDGVSILFYLQKIFPDEWNNFRERMNNFTLTKTVRGMMYYRKALELQAFVDMAKDEGIKPWKNQLPSSQEHAELLAEGNHSSLWLCLQTIDMIHDNYMEEAFKMWNLLQELLKKHDGERYPTILGLREHIFTGSMGKINRQKGIDLALEKVWPTAKRRCRPILTLLEGIRRVCMVRMATRLEAATSWKDDDLCSKIVKGISKDIISCKAYMSKPGEYEIHEGKLEGLVEIEEGKRERIRRAKDPKQ